MQGRKVILNSHCERSEAISFYSRVLGLWSLFRTLLRDCFVTTFLAMTCKLFYPLSNENVAM
jgi:hypothetical protein